MADVDLGLEGGTVVTGGGRRTANVYVADERIVEVTADRLPARERVDASGLLVMPGMVDVHVHLMDPADTSREDFPTGTAAAARAGVTTVVEHSHGGPVRSAEDLGAKAAYLRGRSRVDFALGAHAWPGRTELVAPVWGAGAAFVKAFTCTTHGVPGHDPAHLLQLLEVAAGAGATCLLHCEDESLTALAEWRLREAGRGDGGVIPAWRSREAEQAAVATAAALARATGARTVIAHASHPQVVELARGLVVETCPQYLTLREDEVVEQGALRKFTPPARARSAAELDAMWQAVASGAVEYVASDHAPSSRAQKRVGTIWDADFGLPGLDTTFSVLLDGAARGLLTYERVVEVYSEAPARVYGLRGKGRLEPGSDADLVLVDPDRSWTVLDRDVISKAGWTPFAGRTLRGRAVRTYLRGRLASAEGEVLAEPGWGRFLPGPGSKEGTR
jgi:dihydroorotase (multifunctional complex type)